MINEKIFRSYDIRGIYPDEINEDAAYEAGRAFAWYTKSDIVVGRDMRPSSKPLFGEFARGVNSVGYNVFELKECTTPMLNFAVAHKRFKAGAMITASHNPAQYNGIKLIGEKAVQYNKERGIGEIKEIAVGGEAQDAPQKGEIKKLDILQEYIDWILSKIPEIKKLRAVVDCGNGIAAISARPVFEKMGLDVIWLYEDPDGTFPNHDANPAEEKNLEDAKKKIIEEKADLGIVFDGDGDRAFFLDESGNNINPGFTLAAIAAEELKLNPPKKQIYYDLRFSHAVPESIEKNGGIPVKTKVGNPFFKQQLILQGGLMAAEYSGHFMYSEHYGLDDGLFSALKFMYWLSKTGGSVSEFIRPYQEGHFVTGEINIETQKAPELIARLEEKYKNGKIDKMDGVTVEFEDWWFNLRASNTEPVVRLNIEADSQKLLEEKKKGLIEIIERM